MGEIRPYKPRNRKYEIKPPFDRFLEKFKVDLKTGCWIWTGSKSNQKGTQGGYGNIFLYKTKQTNKTVKMLAHRFSYMMFVGPIPDDKEIDHICRVHICVNPAHLRTVSRRENLLLGETFAAHHASKRKCKYGHPFSPENIWYDKNGSRQCKTCRKLKTKHRSV